MAQGVRFILFHSFIHSFIHFISKARADHSLPVRILARFASNSTTTTTTSLHTNQPLIPTMSLIYSKTGAMHRSSLALTATATLTTMTAGLVLALYSKGYHRRMVRFLRTIPPKIYDVVILNMTEVWYRAVLSRLDDGTALLDVGIGTGGALCRCADLVRAKNLKIIGLDYDAAYVDAAKQNVVDLGLQDRVRVVCMSVYDEDKLYRLGDVLGRMNSTGGNEIDILNGAPSIPSVDDPDTCGGGMVDKTVDSRVGHHHPHLQMRDDHARDDAVINRTNSEALSEANSEAEREHLLHDLLEHKANTGAEPSAPGSPDFKRMNTPMVVTGEGDIAANADTDLHTPKAPAEMHDAEHPQTAHDYSPPPTPGRDHNIHWEAEPPMPWHLDASEGDSDEKIATMTEAASVTKPRKVFGAVYFSGSFSLLPDPPAALRMTSKLLADNGKIYITQTFQRKTLPFLNVIKPWIYYITSIDFGQLITTSDILGIYKEVDEELEVESHALIEGSIDTVLQGAYLSVLRHKVEEDAI